jgi:hypothetical protein
MATTGNRPESPDPYSFTQYCASIRQPLYKSIFWRSLAFDKARKVRNYARVAKKRYNPAVSSVHGYKKPFIRKGGAFRR